MTFVVIIESTTGKGRSFTGFIVLRQPNKLKKSGLMYLKDFVFFYYRVFHSYITNFSLVFMKIFSLTVSGEVLAVWLRADCPSSPSALTGEFCCVWIT